MSEIETQFEDVAKSIAQDPKVRKALNGGKPHLAADRIMGSHLSKFTLADLIRQCIRNGSEQEVEMILEEEINR